MLLQKTSPARIYLLFLIILSVSAVLGFLLALGKIGSCNLPAAISPVIDSKIKSAVIGEDFLITFDANPSTGYSWEVDFDKNYLMLRSKDFVPDRVSPDTVGAGGKEVFTFAPLKAGKTTIRAGYSRPWESKAVEIKVFKYDINEKTSNDSSCGQKAKISDFCSAVGFEFNSAEAKCVVVNGAGCIDKLPFGSLEECQKTCGKNAVSSNKLKFETILKNNFFSEQMENKNYVVKNESEWISILQKANVELPAPVDFTKDMVIAAFQGSKSTGGYSIEINKIIEKENTVEVSVFTTSPGRGCMVTQAFTSPYHIVKLTKQTKEIDFNIIERLDNCESYSQ